MTIRNIHDRFENNDAAGAYALNGLPAEERQAFERQIDIDPDLRSEVDQLGEVTEAMALYLVENPPAGVKARVIGIIENLPQVEDIQSAPNEGSEVLATVAELGERRAIRRGSLVALTTMAAAIILVVGFITANPPSSTVEDQIAAAMADRNASVVELAGENGMLRIITLPGSSDAVLVGSGLADLGEDQTYQLWAIDSRADDAAPVSAGTFDLAGNDVRAILSRTDVESPIWAVSIEPMGGSPQPTGEIVLISA